MQLWTCDFTEIKQPVVHFLFDHVQFIIDLLGKCAKYRLGESIAEDWSPVSQPDIISFIPYIWEFKFKFLDALVILPVSQHNWVDCIQNKIEKSETG
eukprot:sb/3479036/